MTDPKAQPAASSSAGPDLRPRVVRLLRTIGSVVRRAAVWSWRKIAGVLNPEAAQTDPEKETKAERRQRIKAIKRQMRGLKKAA